jgi:hypothetical protein
VTRIAKPPSTAAAVRPQNASRATESRPANTTPATTGAWGAKAPAKLKKPALSALDGTLVTPEKKATGPATVATAIAGVPVRSATVSQFQGLTSPNELMTRTTDVVFGKLTQPQFDALKSEFGGRSAVKFNPAREYTAIDFLPPALQALVNKDLDTGGYVTVKGTKKLAEELMMGDEVRIGATPNCHGTAWEAMRQYQGAGAHVQLAYGDAQMADSMYAEKFDTVSKALPGEALDLSKLKPGDVLSFNKHDKQYGDMDLLHSATYVGGGLFFEKPDTESDEYGESPYRLVTLEQVTAPIANFLGEGEGMSMTARHPKAALAATAEVYASSVEDVSQLEKLLNKRGETVGKLLTTELEMGMGGGVRGMAFNAVVTKKVEVDAEGRGVIR